MTRTRYGGMSALRPVQGMSAFRPVRSMVRSASGAEYVRSAVWADCLRFAGHGRTAGLFSPASARLAAPLGLLGCAGAGRRPHPRRNGARLPPAVVRAGGGAMRGCCCCRFRWSGSSLCRCSFSGVYPTRRSWPAPRWDWASRRSSPCVVCLLRWRRLRAEAEMRLWELKAERRRRDMLCARAAAEGGGR